MPNMTCSSGLKSRNWLQMESKLIQFEDNNFSIDKFQINRLIFDNPPTGKQTWIN